MFAILHRYAKQKQKRSEDEWAEKKTKVYNEKTTSSLYYSRLSLTIVLIIFIHHNHGSSKNK